MDLYDAVKHHFETLEALHVSLNKCFGAFADGVGYAVQELTSKEEDDLIGNDVDQLQVTPVNDAHRIETLVKFHGVYTVNPNFDATRFVRRMPGILVLRQHHPSRDKVISLCKSINSIRHDMLIETRKEASRERRFQIVHNALPGFMSEHVERAIRFIDEPVKSISFNWTRNPVPKALSRDNMAARLKAAIKDPILHKLKDDQRVVAQYNLQRLEEGHFVRFQYRRDSAPKPVAMFVFRDKDKKYFNTSCATPMILTAQPNDSMPIKINALADYRHKPKSKPAGPIKNRVQMIPDFPLYGELKT